MISGNHLVCYDTIEECKSHCINSECFYASGCNGSAATKYVCLPIDWRFITWLMIGSFLIVLICCSSLVACYVCHYVKVNLRHAIKTDSAVVFHNSAPIHHYSLPD